MPLRKETVYILLRWDRDKSRDCYAELKIKSVTYSREIYFTKYHLFKNFHSILEREYKSKGKIQQNCYHEKTDAAKKQPWLFLK